ncbi:MAG: hypothetical protein M3Q07_20660 [Pseudobdellovibrionaceae bacterium]|nr:hypothetical protein [Pseudobdellovibrionaceae bacterium]
MEHPLIEPLSYKGKKYETATLSDYFKTRHKLVLAENVKKSEELQHQALVMSFCENLPPESFGDISADDMDVIAEHVNSVMTKYAESHGMIEGQSPGKKKVPPAGPRIRPATRHAR